MSHATLRRTFHVAPDPIPNVADLTGATPDSVDPHSSLRQPSTAALCALPTGSLIASNPPGPRPSHFKVLGNDQVGFQVWLSRDGLTWLPFGDASPTYAELAAAFAASHPRPAVVLDSVVALAYDTGETAATPATPDLVESSADEPDSNGA